MDISEYTYNHMRKIVLIDDSAYMHRYYFAYPKKRNNYNGTSLEIGALTGILEFTNKVKKFVNDDVEIIHILDPDNGSDYRKSILPNYKDRKEKEFDLKRQIELLPLVLSGYGQKIIKIDGIESDDIIAKYSKIYGDDNFVLLMAEDKDIYQNIIDYREDGKNGIVSGCRYSKNSQGFNDFDFIFSDFILEKFGVSPKQLADFLALSGDTADNIPGVSGIGDVAAKKLLTEYGNVSNIISAAESGNLEKKYLNKILNGIDSLILSRKLTLPFLDFDVPLIEDLKINTDLSIKYEAQKIVPPSLKWELI